MNLYKEGGEWSDELLSDCAKKGIPPNQHPEVKKLPEADYPEGEDVAFKCRPEQVEARQKALEESDAAPEGK